jgi:hypothetical protein
VRRVSVPFRAIGLQRPAPFLHVPSRPWRSIARPQDSAPDARICALHAQYVELALDVAEDETRAMPHYKRVERRNSQSAAGGGRAAHDALYATRQT